MEFYNGYLQENLKHFAPEKVIGLDYVSLTLTAIERDIENALHWITTFMSTIVWRVIFVNQYYNFPAEFLEEKVGQIIQAPRQLGRRSCLETNRFEICRFHRVKRLHETIFPLPVEVGNYVSNIWEHFFPRRAGEILLRVNKLPEQFREKIHELWTQGK